mmetsp:Transcript_2671/g.10384  ORF Transcript_2671/g.10384 Transcript_2671/m.10384 type:complete len:407 (+) Transcript_2671:1817-3037(+)
MLDRDLNGVAAAQGIKLQGPLLLHANIRLPDVPLRVQLVRGEGLHPVREALVEPQVVPPAHGDQVAEPLVRQLVRDDRADALLLAGAHRLLVAEQRHLSVRDQAPILHGAGSKVRDRNHIQLRQRIRNTEELVVELERADASLQGIRTLRTAAGAAENPADDTTFRLVPDVLVLADAECQQVGAHVGCLQECLHALAVLSDLRRALRHVRQRREAIWEDQGHHEDGLACGLVPTREAPPGIDGLKLRGGHVLLVALGVCVLGAVEAGHLVVQDAPELDLEDAFADGQHLREAKRAGHLFDLDVDIVGRETLGGVRRRELGAGYHELLRVEGDAVGGLLHVHGDLHAAVEHEALKVGLQRQVILLGLDVRGQQDPVRGILRHRDRCSPPPSAHQSEMQSNFGAQAAV